MHYQKAELCWGPPLSLFSTHPLHPVDIDFINYQAQTLSVHSGSRCPFSRSEVLDNHCMLASKGTIFTY